MAAVRMELNQLRQHVEDLMKEVSSISHCKCLNIKQCAETACLHGAVNSAHDEMSASNKSAGQAVSVTPVLQMGSSSSLAVNALLERLLVQLHMKSVISHWSHFRSGQHCLLIRSFIACFGTNDIINSVYEKCDVSSVIREISDVITELQQFCIARNMNFVYVIPGLIGSISLPVMTEVYGKLQTFLDTSHIMCA